MEGVSVKRVVGSGQTHLNLEELNDQTVFIPADATLLTCAHEVGHALGLSTKAVGQANKHDLGAWPHEWAKDGRVGLIYPEATPKMQPWIRQEDWAEAYRKADLLK